MRHYLNIHVPQLLISQIMILYIIKCQQFKVLGIQKTTINCCNSGPKLSKLQETCRKCTTCLAPICQFSSCTYNVVLV